MALIVLEIFSPSLVGLESGTKEATLHFPDLLLPTAQQNNQSPSIWFCVPKLHEGQPAIHTQATSIVISQFDS